MKSVSRKVIKDGQVHHVSEQWLRANAIRKKNPFKSTRKRNAHELHRQGQILLETQKILDKFEIPMILSDGLVLGIVRHGDFVPWDFDADLFVLYEDVKDIGLDLAAAFLKKGFTSYKFKADPWNWKLAMSKDDYLVELRGWRREDDYYIRYDKGAGKSIFKVPCRFFDYLVAAELRGGTYLIPMDEDDYLTHNYGDWRKEVRSTKATEYFASTYMEKQRVR